MVNSEVFQHLGNRKVRQLRQEWCIRLSHLSHHTAWKKFALFIVLFSSSSEPDAAGSRAAAESSTVGCRQGIFLTQRLHSKLLEHFCSSKCIVQIPTCICAAQFTFLELTFLLQCRCQPGTFPGLPAWAGTELSPGDRDTSPCSVPVCKVHTQ